MPEGTAKRRSLLGAIGASLLLHGLLLIAADAALQPDRGRPKDSATTAALSARLRVAAASPAPAALPARSPELRLPETPRPGGRAASKLARSPATIAVPASAPVSTELVRRRAMSQLAGLLLYPLEAVNRGLEGEVQVLLFLDAAGNVVAARVEQSSGHALLDSAAVTAARQLRALPTAAAGEVLLPVRFRLD